MLLVDGRAVQGGRGLLNQLRHGLEEGEEEGNEEDEEEMDGTGGGADRNLLESVLEEVGHVLTRATLDVAGQLVEGRRVGGRGLGGVVLAGPGDLELALEELLKGRVAGAILERGEAGHLAQGKGELRVEFLGILLRVGAVALRGEVRRESKENG